MSAITPILTAMTSELVTEVLLIVAALAGLVGIGILVTFGFRHLRQVGEDRDYAQEAWDRQEEIDDSWL